MSIRIKGNPTEQELKIALESLRKKTILLHGEKSLGKHFGRLKRGLDGVEYQNALRHEWD